MSLSHQSLTQYKSRRVETGSGNQALRATKASSAWYIMIEQAEICCEQARVAASQDRLVAACGLLVTAASLYQHILRLSGDALPEEAKYDIRSLLLHLEQEILLYQESHKRRRQPLNSY